MDIPHLGQKLQFLYAKHELVRTNEALAGELFKKKDGAMVKGIDPGNIAQWIHGIEGIKAPNTAPKNHISRICKIFSISEKTFLLENLLEFKAVVDGGMWQELLNEVPIDKENNLKLVRRINPKVLTLYDLDGQQYERFSRGESVYVKLTLPNEQVRDIAGVKKPHLIILSVDAEKTVCLFPASGEQTTVEKDQLTIPENWSKQGMLVTGNSGEQHLIAILTPFKFDHDLYCDLQNDNNDDALNRLAAKLEWINNDNINESLILKHTYIVL